METTQYHINELRRQKMTWQQIGDLIGISRSLAWNVAHGKCDSHKARHYFGLPPKMVEVVPCLVEGCVDKIHIKSHPNPKDKGRHRVGLEFDLQDDQEEMIYLLSLLSSNRKHQSQIMLNWLRYYTKDKARPVE